MWLKEMITREGMGVLSAVSIGCLTVIGVFYIVYAIEDPIIRLVPGICTAILGLLALSGFAYVYGTDTERLTNQDGVGTPRRRTVDEHDP